MRRRWNATTAESHSPVRWVGVMDWDSQSRYMSPDSIQSQTCWPVTRRTRPRDFTWQTTQNNWEGASRAFGPCSFSILWSKHTLSVSVITPLHCTILNSCCARKIRFRSHHPSCSFHPYCDSSSVFHLIQTGLCRACGPHPALSLFLCPCPACVRSTCCWFSPPTRHEFLMWPRGNLNYPPLI